jgi:small subunit ribosomal protein S15
MVHAMAASRDIEKASRWKHAGTLTEADIEQVQVLEQQSASEANLPLFDRLMAQCNEELKGGGNAYQHGLQSPDVRVVLGSLEEDVGRAVLDEKTVVTVDERRSLVERIVGMSTSNAAQKLKYRMKRIREVFGKHDTDVGSAQVQAALMTLKIRNRVQHVYDHPQDTTARIELDELSHRRRKTLAYLKRIDFPAYMKMIKDLGLKVA